MDFSFTLTGILKDNRYFLYTIIDIIVYNIKKLVKNEVNYAKSLF